MTNQIISQNKVCVTQGSLSTGIDIVYNDEMRELIDDSTETWLTKREWKDVINSKDKIQRAAGKFACKEAILKVLGHGISEVDLTDIEILHNRDGKPMVFLQRSALRYWQNIEAEQLDVSISHHKDYTVAIAIALN